MSIITVPKERRKRQKEDVSLLQPAIPPQAQPVAPQQPQPQYTNPAGEQIAAPGQGVQQAPGTAVVTGGGQTLTQADLPAMRAKHADQYGTTNPSRFAEPSIRAVQNEEARQQRVVADFEKTGLQEMPDSDFRPPAPAPIDPESTSVVPPGTTGTVESKISGDYDVQRYRKFRDQTQAMRDAGKTISPDRLSRLKTLRSAADTRAALHIKEGKADQDKKQAEMQAKSTKDSATTQRAIESHRWAKESHERGESTRQTAAADKKRNSDMAKMLGAAQDAAKDGRYDDAEKMAEAGQTNANTPAEAAAFNAVRKEVQAAKAKAKDAENKQAARAMQPQVDAANNDLKDAQAALNAVTALLKTAILWDDATGDKDKDAATKAKVAEIRKSVPVARAARDQASARLSELTNRQSDAAEGIEQREPAANPKRQAAGPTGTTPQPNQPNTGPVPAQPAQQIPPPAQRVNGQAYRLPNGQSGRWNAQAGGWEIVQ